LLCSVSVCDYMWTIASADVGATSAIHCAEVYVHPNHLEMTNLRGKKCYMSIAGNI
jgi:hypothetical protein